MNLLAKYAAWGLCALCVTFLMLGTAVAASVPEKAGKTVVATVNGTAIYHDDLTPLLDSAKARYLKSGYRTISPELEKKIQREELEHLIGRELLAQAGAKENDKAFAEQVELRIKAAGKARFHNAASAVEEKPAALDAVEQERLRSDAIIDAYLEKRGVNSLQVPEKDLKEFYEKNKQGLASPETVKASHILVAVPKIATAEDVEEARKKILGIAEELKQGGDFAELAKKYSSCATAANGGDLGYIQADYMPREFNAVAFALKPGETSEPVLTRHGFHIVKVLEKQPSRVPEFSEVKDMIARYLIKGYQRKKVDEIIAELKQRARIETYIDG